MKTAVSSVRDQSFIPRLLEKKGNTATRNLTLHVAGVLCISSLAQASIHLPWTPVPITGQTFGVALISLLWGRKRACAILSSYLFLGFSGFPLFSMGKTGFGPTTGYLFGMLASSYVVGSLADKGYAESFPKALCACFIGSITVFTFGLIGLAFFVKSEDLLMSGLIPFLPGDLIKSVSASLIASALAKASFKESA